MRKMSKEAVDVFLSAGIKVRENNDYGSSIDLIFPNGKIIRLVAEVLEQYECIYINAEVME